MNLRDAIIKRKKNTGDLEPKVVYTTGITVAVDYPNDPSVANRAGFIWVKENGQDSGIFQCFNPSVKAISNLPVIVSHSPKRPLRRIVIGVNWDKLSVVTVDDSYSLVNHHYTHEWPEMYPGSDAVNVFIRAIVPFRVYPGKLGVTINVAHAKYVYNGNVVQYYGTDEWDMSDSLPTVAGNYRVSLVYLNPSTNLVKVIDGDETAYEIPTYPTLPDGMVPLVYIRLRYGMTYIAEADIIEDARPLFSFNQPISVTQQYITQQLALLEAEFDFALTKHIVEG